jgi:hypothetical protein
MKRENKMAKNTANKVDTAAMDNHDLKAGVDIGAVDVAGMEDAALITNNPALVPGKNWGIGTTVGGNYLDTTRVYSDKFTAGKKDRDGRIYRDLHNLRDANGKEFGIWSVGTLAAFFRRLPAGAKVAIKYTGLGTAPIKPGQSVPHLFEFKTAPGVRLLPAVDAEAVEGDAAAPAVGNRAAGMENANYANQ